jgi:hypothetical protein
MVASTFKKTNLFTINAVTGMETSQGIWLQGMDSTEVYLCLNAAQNASG